MYMHLGTRHLSYSKIIFWVKFHSDEKMTELTKSKLLWQFIYNTLCIKRSNCLVYTYLQYIQFFFNSYLFVIIKRCSCAAPKTSLS